jgi:hypothetical protein
VLITIGILLTLAITAVCGPMFGVCTRFSYVLVVPAFVYGFFLKMGSKKKLREEPLYEVIVETVLIVTGLSAIAWNLLT